MRKASPGDISDLVQLMAEFYAEASYSLNRKRAEQAFAAVLADDRCGWVWLIEQGTLVAGYVVVTVCFSMEYGGPIAFVDDFFVRRNYRGLGLGTKALSEVRDHCLTHGIRGMAVEVAVNNPAAQKVYRRTGFVETGRQLLRLGIAEPTHV